MFREVWQTWSFVCPVDPRQAVSATPGEASGTQTDLRKSFQMKRLQKRLSLWDMSERVGCSADALSAFERGTDVLDEDTLRRIRVVLDR